MAPKPKKGGQKESKSQSGASTIAGSDHLFNIYQSIPQDHELLPDKYYPDWLWKLTDIDKSYGELVLMFVHGKDIENATIYDYIRFRRLYNKSQIRINNLRLQKKKKLTVKTHFFDV